MELREPDDSQRNRQRRVRRVDLLPVVLQGRRWELLVRHRRDLRSQYINLGLAEERPRLQSDRNEGTSAIGDSCLERRERLRSRRDRRAVGTGKGSFNDQ